MSQQTQDKKWVEFWLETNYIWGLITSQEEWLKSLVAWGKGNPLSSPSDIYNCAKKAGVDYNYDENVPSFGTRAEHINGEMTLGEFFDMHGMEKVVPPIEVPSK